jgi:hypothetical protein
MWRLGDIATDGLKEIAEWGNTYAGEGEMKGNVSACCFRRLEMVRGTKINSTIFSCQISNLQLSFTIVQTCNFRLLFSTSQNSLVPLTKFQLRKIHSQNLSF